MAIKIALAGNPNSGKTTLFNALTGSNQFVGNWPGVTVEKKEGKLKGHKDVTIIDLPGIYSLSPYTLEEVVARNYLLTEKPDAIINIVDGTNIERNLYLSTQIMELGIPVVMAVNMMDLVEKSGDQIHIDKLGKRLGCEVVEISALKGTGIKKAAEKAVALAQGKKSAGIVHEFAKDVEDTISTVEDKLFADIPAEQKRFFAIKLLERDNKIAEQLSSIPDVSQEIEALEKKFDDDKESIITNERYVYISSIIGECCTKNQKQKLTLSDKIDKVVTNRILALPIFAVVMFIVYYVSVTTVGSWATDWANEGVFGDGWKLFGVIDVPGIPVLIESGCGVPGVMASRTIENDRDRKMTIMTTTFIPCGAKLPIIALIAGAIFDNAGWVSVSCYFVGIAAIICSGIILKKTKMFAGDPAPFVMELPAYHMPTVGNVLRSMWERGWSFIKKAGTIILLSTIVVWFLMSFGWVDGSFTMLEAEQLDSSILSSIGNLIAWIFIPLGWGDWKMAVAAITGLVAKENVVGTFGMLYGFAEVAEDGAEIWSNLSASLAPVAAYSFLVFNLLCAPCFAAMGAIKREMNNAKWFWFAIGYQCFLAYVVSLCIYQIGMLITAGSFGIGTVVAFLFVIGFVYLLFRPYKESETLDVNIKMPASAK